MAAVRHAGAVYGRIFEAEVVRQMSRLRFVSGIVCAALAGAAAGCHRADDPARLAAAQQEFLQAFLAAHNSKDADVQMKLVDWDDVGDVEREHFSRESIRATIEFKITSATIEDIPGLNDRFTYLYNIPPEKFLVVVYDDPRGDDLIKFPIGRKDGKYCFAMRGLTKEALQRKAKQFKKTTAQ